MIAEGKVSDASQDAYAQSTTTIEEMIAAMAKNGGQEELSNTYRQYESAMAQEVSALADGDVQRALKIDEAQVDPAFESLDEAISDQIAVHAGNAHETGQVARAGTVVAIVLASVAAGFLVIRHEKSIRSLTISLEAKVRDRTKDLRITNEQLDRLYREARQRAKSDSLTGLLNHSQFQEKVKEAILAATSTGEKVAVILMDVDRFKAINDTMGHQSGDEIIKEIAEIIRSNDAASLAFRPGGDEFAILSCGAAAEQARQTAERVRAAVSSATLAANVTISAGVAVFKGATLGHEQLVLAADRALYQAKSLGRNRVVVWGEGPDGAQSWEVAESDGEGAPLSILA